MLAFRNSSIWINTFRNVLLLKRHVIKNGPSLVKWRVERVRHNDNKPCTQSYSKAVSALCVRRLLKHTVSSKSYQVRTDTGGFESWKILRNRRRTERNNEVKLACLLSIQVYQWCRYQHASARLTLHEKTIFVGFSIVYIWNDMLYMSEQVRLNVNYNIEFHSELISFHF